MLWSNCRAFGKHTDKLLADSEKGVKTLPVLLGERLSRHAVIAMFIAQYLLSAALVVTGSFALPLLLVLLNLPSLPVIFAAYRHPKPAQKPDNYPAEAWPLWFSAYAFTHTRKFTLLFLLGVVLDTLFY